MHGQRPRIFSFWKRREGGDVSFFSSQNEGNPLHNNYSIKKTSKFVYMFLACGEKTRVVVAKIGEGKEGGEGFFMVS